MDHTELKKLVELMNENDLVELEIEREGLRVSLKKAVAAIAVAMPQPGMAPAPALAPPPASPDAGAPAGATAEVPGTKLIKSPMVGTFYRRPSPDSDPYVEVGHTVDPESVVCIVEAMKVNNEIQAEMRGEILEILAEDGQPVEYDEPLFRVKAG